HHGRGGTERPRARELADLPGDAREAARPADRRRRAWRRVLLRNRTGQGQGDEGDLRRRRIGAPAARVPVEGPVRRRSVLPCRRSGRPRHPAGPAADDRASRVRRDRRHPAQRADGSLVPALTVESPDYRGLSFWHDSVSSDLHPRAGLPGDLDVDVAIVGGGLTGLWTAYYLARRDPALRIAVLEKHIAGFGASGRNGGWCSALFPAS